MPTSSKPSPASAVEQLRSLLRDGHLPGHFHAPSTMPVLKNYLEPCRLAFSPVLQHEAHDELVRNAEPLVRALSTPRPHHSSHMDMDFHEALLVKVLDYADLLNAALPIDAQLDAHIGNGVTLYLAGSGHTLIGLAMPHDHSDEEVAALVDHIKAGGVYVCDGKVSDCALQPAVNNLLLLMTHNYVNFGILSNYTTTVLIRFLQATYPPLTPLVEVSRIVKLGDEPAPLLSHSPLGLAIGAVMLAIKERGVEFGKKDEPEWELLKKLKNSTSRY